MRIASIVGARPNFIKLAPVSRELRKEFEELIIHTGQHYDYELNKICFDELGIPAPDYHLGVGSGSHGYQTGEMFKRTEEVLASEQPDQVLAQRAHSMFYIAVGEIGNAYAVPVTDPVAHS
jgi:UDP-N-acetylglucosamine 2-epimerase